ncbi:hypothetical protein WJX74_008897 [Apatococcus lobatus]|uniref:Enoyl reductase (ER) domain-containing protein n=1 Tax=Apatococcus lobatus TaxID=904363 RepID=A0AAW1SAY6_9CHLO
MAFRCCLQRLQQSAATQLATAGSSRSFAANALVDQEAALWRSSAAVLHGVNDLRFEDVSMPERVAEGSCRVEMKAVGICGSDVHFWKKGRLADFVLTGPMIIGHESAGTVVELGPGVSHLRVGDRVAVEGGVPCWHSKASREGRYNLCPELTFFATPPTHGSLSQYIDHPAHFCYPIPSNLTHEEGAMAEPLSVGVHACRRAGVSPGKNVAIIGAGPIGLMMSLAAKAFGADAIAVTDVKEDNLALADQLGANVALLQQPHASIQDVAAALRTALPPFGPDIIIDCAGFESTMQTAMAASVPGGKVVLVGMGQNHMKLAMGTASCREVDLLGSFRYANTYPLCLKLMESKKVDVTPLITHRFGFTAADVAAAFDTASRASETGAIKVMFNL